MSRKTISIDTDVYRQIKRRQLRQESLSMTLRRVLEEKDPADYLEDLFRDFGRSGVMSDEGLARVRARRRSPPRSQRPASSARADAA